MHACVRITVGQTAGLIQTTPGIQTHLVGQTAGLIQTTLGIQTHLVGQTAGLIQTIPGIQTHLDQWSVLIKVKMKVKGRVL